MTYKVTADLMTTEQQDALYLEVSDLHDLISKVAYYKFTAKQSLYCDFTDDERNTLRKLLEKLKP